MFDFNKNKYDREEKKILNMLSTPTTATKKKHQQQHQKYISYSTTYVYVFD